MKLATLFIFGCLKILLASVLLSAQPLEDRGLKIGAILPLSGPTADYGQAIVNAILLAQRDFPDQFRHVSFTFEDAQYDVKKAVGAFQKLAHSDKVDLIFTWGVSFCKALAPMADRDKIATVGECIDPSSSRGKTYFLRFMNDSDQFLALTAKFLDVRGAKRFGIVLTDSAYLEEMLEGLKRNLMAGQSVDVIQRYQADQMDVRDSVARVRQKKYDAVGVFLSAGQIAAFYRELAAQNLTPLTFGTNYYESFSEIAAAQGTMNGSFFVNVDINPSFAKRYEEEFHTASQLAFAAPAYEFARTAAEIAHAQKEKLQGLPLISAFRKRSEQQGVAAGPYRFKDTERAGAYFEFPVTVKYVCKNHFHALRESDWKRAVCH